MPTEPSYAPDTCLVICINSHLILLKALKQEVLLGPLPRLHIPVQGPIALEMEFCVPTAWTGLHTYPKDVTSKIGLSLLAQS